MKVFVALFLVFGLTCAKPLVEAKKYYIFTLTPHNWYAAFLDCMSRNLQLATVNSAYEQLALEQAIKDANAIKDNIWLSGADLAQEGKFVWMTTGRLTSYDNWLAGEPSNSNGNENCLSIGNSREFGKWNDESCATEMFHVCEDISQAEKMTGRNVIVNIN